MRLTTSFAVGVLTVLATAGTACASTPPRAAATHSATALPAPQSLRSPITSATPGTTATEPVIPSAPTNVTPAPGIPKFKQTIQPSNNWSGYLDSGVSQNYFNYVYSRWTAPKFTCDAVLGKSGSQTSQWIGIDGGPKDPSLEQDGTIEGCTGNGQAYDAYFWETIPGPPHTYGQNQIVPGDQMAATVTYIGNNDFQFVVADLTRGGNINVTEPCIASSCPLNYDEAIAEWPGKQLASGITLTKYQPFPFYNYYATSYYAPTDQDYYGWFSATSLFNVSEIHTLGPKKIRHGRFPKGQRVVQGPSALLDGGRAFYDNWRAAY